MDEQEWLNCETPRLMLQWLKGNASARKLRLFVCACCRRLWHRMTEPRSQDLIQAVERFVDGQVSSTVLAGIVRESSKVPKDFDWRASGALGVVARRVAAKAIDWGGTWQMSAMIASAYAYGGGGHAAQQAQEFVRQACLLRHIIGNPFRPQPRPLCPSVVAHLGESVYAGEPCTFALHDALLDAGHAELAAHFRDPDAWHPKGCWALDLILGKS